MPVALDIIRKLGRAGHAVYAADTFYAAPGSHSRWVSDARRVAAPTSAPLAFLADVARVIREGGIDLVVPCFEEVFYLARHRDDLPSTVQLFAADFAALARLHDKAGFNRLARELGIAAPETVVVESDGELAAALRAAGRYFARPAWSRGGIDLLTNAGPLAGELDAAACHPTREHPWIVQPYVDGDDVCTFSLAQHGRVVAHCAYVHPRELDHSGGIVFESITDDETLRHAQRVCEALRYHGPISMDFSRSARGLVAFECNPRPTAGVHLMPDAMFLGALLSPPRRVAVVPPGVRRKYASALLRDMLLHWRDLGADLGYLLSDATDVYGEKGDRLPALYQFVSYARVMAYRYHHRRHPRARMALKAAQFDGIEWNGERIP
jgi:hypothetical protein